MQEYKLNNTKAIVTISTIAGYHPGEENVTGMSFDEFCAKLQEIEENYQIGSISWVVRPGKAVYKQAWGAPKGGEDIFVLETDYTEYDKGTDIHDWKHNVFVHVENLKEIFKQETVRVTFINGVETTIVR